MSTGFAGGTKFSGVTVSTNISTTGTIYSVPAGKTLIGSYTIYNRINNTEISLVLAGGVVSICSPDGSGPKTVTGVLNATGAVNITAVFGPASGGLISVFGVLEENQ